MCVYIKAYQVGQDVGNSYPAGLLHLRNAARVVAGIVYGLVFVRCFVAQVRYMYVVTRA